MGQCDVRLCDPRHGDARHWDVTPSDGWRCDPGGSSLDTTGKPHRSFLRSRV